jgi:hypothetical protein
MSVVVIHESFSAVGICICDCLQACAYVKSRTEITSYGLHTCHVFGRKDDMQCSILQAESIITAFMHTQCEGIHAQVRENG